MRSLSMILILLLMDNIEVSRGFCDEELEYSCIQDGTTQCRPKTDRCKNGSNCTTPLPIEKPPCKQECQEGHEYWCEERGQCINKNEACDCGPEKAFCVFRDMYSCENRHGIASSSIFHMCRDGSCLSDCAKNNNKTICKEGQFKCGDECKNISQVTEYRNCLGECIPANEFCYQIQTIEAPPQVLQNDTSPLPANESSSVSHSGSIAAAAIIAIILFLLCSFFYFKWKTLKQLRKLHLKERVMKNGYEEKKQEINISYSRDAEDESIAIVPKAIDIHTFETLCKEIKDKKKTLCGHLFSIKRYSEEEKDIEKYSPIQETPSLEIKIEKFIEDGYVHSNAGVNTKGQAEENAEIILETSSPKESLCSKLKRLKEHNHWLLVEEEHTDRGCYCLICLQAGISNEFTTTPGAAPNEQNIARHSQVSPKTQDPSLSEQVTIIEMEPDKIIEVSKESHQHAEQIIEQVDIFSKEAIASRPTFSLIIYEQGHHLSLILKGLKIMDTTESLKNIYIPLDIIQMSDDSHALSILEEIRKILDLWKVKMKQISSISAVNIGGKLPPRAAAVCEMFCTLPECECICIHNLLHEPTLDIQQEHLENVFLKDLRVLASYLSQPIFQNFNQEKVTNNEHDMDIEDSSLENLLQDTPKKSLADIIQFVQAYPKTIGAILDKKQKELIHTTASDEEKLKVSESIQFMGKFSKRASILSYQQIVDMFKEILSFHEDGRNDWDFKRIEKEIKNLELFLEKMSKKGSPTKNNEKVPLLFIQNNQKNIGKGAQNDNTIPQIEINSFQKYQQKCIATTIQDLRTSFPNKSMTIARAMSELLNVNKISVAIRVDKKIQTLSDTYKSPFTIVGEKFSKVKENKEKLKTIDELKETNGKEDQTNVASLLVRKYSHIVPNFAYMAEIYLNININTKQLHELLFEIDEVINMKHPKLKLYERSKKVYAKSVWMMMQELEQNQKKVTLSATPNLSVDKEDKHKGIGNRKEKNNVPIMRRINPLSKVDKNLANNESLKSMVDRKSQKEEKQKIKIFSMTFSGHTEGNNLQNLLKEHKARIQNHKNTKVLLIGECYAGQSIHTQVKNLSKVGESILTNYKNHNEDFYINDCKTVGISAEPSLFVAYQGTTGIRNGDFVHNQAPNDSSPRPNIHSVNPCNLLQSNSVRSDPNFDKMEFKVINMAIYHNRLDLRGNSPDVINKRTQDFVDDVREYNPTVIFLCYCFSPNGDIALALRSENIFSSMIVEHNLRIMTGNSKAKLDDSQKKVVEDINKDSVRHLILGGSSGAGKSWLGCEYVKTKTVEIMKMYPEATISVFVISMGSNTGNEQLGNMLKTKHFAGTFAFQIRCMTCKPLCEFLGLNFELLKVNMIGMMNLICTALENKNKKKEKEDSGKVFSVLMFDEVNISSGNEKVHDYTELIALEALTTVYTVTCIRPIGAGAGGEFTLKLPSITDAQNQPTVFCSQILTTEYRNTQAIRNFNNFIGDHNPAYLLLSRSNDTAGTEIQPAQVGKSLVFWSKCSTIQQMKEAINIIIENEGSKNLVVLYCDFDDEVSKEVALTSGADRVFSWQNFAGCEAETVVVVTNKVLFLEATSRAMNCLLIVTGPDLEPKYQTLLNQAADDKHSNTFSEDAVPSLMCKENPCLWNMNSLHRFPLLDHY